MNRILCSAVAALVAMGIGVARANSPDSSFYRSLAEGGNGEVALGRLAADRGASSRVKDFGAMMVKDHTAANEQLASLARSKDVSLPDGIGVRERTKETELKALSGSSFDKSYLTEQIKAHRATLELLKKEVDSGSDPDAKAFAEKVLPTVETHLAAAERIADSMGIKH
jgi:putative membrane protein